MFPDDCSLFNPQHFDLYGINEGWSGIRENICWEFTVGLIIVIIVTWLLEPPCFAVWIVIIGSYLLLSVLLRMISVITFGVLFSLLYLLDRSLSVNLEC